MATWFDIIALVLIAAFCIGVIYAVTLIVDQVSTAMKNTKEQLKSKGLVISDKGVSVRTSSRFNREDYVDATQRGFIKAMGASSFTTADNSDNPQPVISRQNSGVSLQSNGSSNYSGLDAEEKKEKKRRFGLRKTPSRA